VAIGGLNDAWPLLAMAAGAATLFGFLYVYVMMRCAGPVILASMVITTLFTLAAGIFFFLAIVMDMNDTGTDYARFNPILSTYIGDQAKMLSMIAGVGLILLSITFGAMTSVSMAHIDESIGLIDAACEPFRMAGSWVLWIWPLIASASFLVIAYVIAWFGTQIVASLGSLDYSEISINGKSINGLQRVWKRDTLQHTEFWVYVIGMIWVLEFYLQFCHYVLAYVISCWYFVDVKSVRANNNKLLEQALGRGVGKRVEVRVAGVDTNYAARQGTVVGDGGQKVLVVPVGKKGPGVGRNEMELFNIVKEHPPSFGNMLMGVFSGLTHHIGSIALGSIVIFFFRPFRLVAEFVSAFLARIGDNDKGRAYSGDANIAAIKSCASLLSACLEQVFGKYSKTTWTQLVLGGGGETGKDGFFECSDIAFQRLVKSGGSVAHLHGAMLIYEIFGGLSITTFCGWTVWILQRYLDMFNEPDSSYYIEDKSASLLAALLVAFFMSFAWMSAWGQTADVLLYCVSWNRLQSHEGEEHGLEPGEGAIGEVKEYCPQGLRYLLPEHELDAHMEHGLHAHGLGQQGAILAAMEHGAMGGGSGAPDYGKTIAQSHAMATRMMQG
jgi:hypothetical protein